MREHVDLSSNTWTDRNVIVKHAHNSLYHFKKHKQDFSNNRNIISDIGEPEQNLLPQRFIQYSGILSL